MEPRRSPPERSGGRRPCDGAGEPDAARAGARPACRLRADPEPRPPRAPRAPQAPKAKQLVRSRAIRESQSPPRPPSPGAPREAGPRADAPEEPAGAPEERARRRGPSDAPAPPGAEDASPAGRPDGTRVEFLPVEIQVTSGDDELVDRLILNHPCEIIHRSMRDIPSHFQNDSLSHDCGAGLEIDEDEENMCLTDSTNDAHRESGGRRAACPSKQDSGVYCWDTCNCCGDASPDIMSSDPEEDGCRVRRQKSCSEHDGLDNSEHCRLSDKTTSRRNGSMLTVQRSNSDNSAELSMGTWDVGDLSKFIKETLNKTQKDRVTLLKIEHDLLTFIRDPVRNEHRFPPASSYGRLLVHRCADLFGLRHGVDLVTRQMVTVAKLTQGGSPYRIPSICPFQQWCTVKFPASPTIFAVNPAIPQAKSILKRDTQSLDEELPILTAAPPKLLQTPRSKSFEQREEEYVKARRRIFSSSGLVQSLENDYLSTGSRGVVSKAHSFGGYGGRQGVQRGDSITSTYSAPPHRILSRQGELASSCWRLSPCSSGYKTLSVHSDSITPSPTSTPITINNSSKSVTSDTCHKATGTFNENPNNTDIMGGVLWAITDMSTVPTGAIIIHPQSGQALTNIDGSLYYYDPNKPIHSALLSQTPQISTDSVRVLSNPERRRSRLEKQRATLSPGTESDNSGGEPKNSNFNSESHENNTGKFSNEEPKESRIISNNDLNLTNPQNYHSHPIKKITETNSDSTNQNVPIVLKKSMSEANPVDAVKPEIHKNACLVDGKSFNDTSKENPSSFDYSSNNNNEMYNKNETKEFIKYDEEFINQSENVDSQGNLNKEKTETISSDSFKYSSTLKYNEGTNECVSDIQNYTDTNYSPSPKQYSFNQANLIENKISTSRYDLDERNAENFTINPYTDMQGTNYYGPIPQTSLPHFYSSGTVYGENNQEIYTGPPPPLGYSFRENEQLTPVPSQQIGHPHLVYAPQAPDSSAIGFTPSNELCYSTTSGHVLVQPSPYRIQEQDPQSPYHVMQTSENPPVMTTEMTPQQLTSYSLSYHHPTDRAPVIGSSPALLGVATPHPTLGYQIHSAPNWSCWPQVALYNPHLPPPNADDGSHKYPPHPNTFVPSNAPETTHTASTSSIPQGFYPHAGLMQTQQNHFFTPYQPTQVLPPQYPIYQPYNPNGISILSHEDCQTPNFHTNDLQFATGSKMSDGIYQDISKNRMNVRSPKSINSRGASNSGSSRTTPLTGNIPFNNQHISDANFSNIETNYSTNYHFIRHPTINYIPYHYPYALGGIECVQGNFDNMHLANTKLATNDIPHYNRNNKNFKDVNKNLSPKIYPQKINLSDFNKKNDYVPNMENCQQKKGERQNLPGQSTQVDKNLSISQLRNETNEFISNMDSKNANKCKDRRKNCKNTLELSEVENIEENKCEFQSDQKLPITIKQNPSNEKEIMMNLKEAVTYSNDRSTATCAINNVVKKTSEKQKDLNDEAFKSNIDANGKISSSKIQPSESQQRHVKSSWSNRDNESESADVPENSQLNIKVTQIRFSHKNVYNNTPQNAAFNSDSKSSWRKCFNQKDYHNFPKNINRQSHKYSNASGLQQSHYERDRVFSRNHSKEKLQNFNNANHRTNFHSFDNAQSPIQITPTSMNAPPVPWNQKNSVNSHINNSLNKTESPGSIITLTNMNQQIHPQQSSIIPSNRSRPNESPSSINPLSFCKGNLSKVNSVDICTPHQRFLDTSIVGFTNAQSPAYYQRNQVLQNLTSGGLGLMQTPPLHNQSAFFLRQVPNWLRRPPGPALFGPAPQLTGQIRAKPPRHHHPHPRNFY